LLGYTSVLVKEAANRAKKKRRGSALCCGVLFANMIPPIGL